MGGRRYRRIIALAVASVLAAGTAAGLAAGTAAGLAAATAAPALASASPASSQICVSKAHPRLARRLSSRITGALRGRQGAIGLAAADTKLGLTCSLNAGGHFYAASVIKVTIISALLLKEGGVGHLTKRQHALAWKMITESDNDAATALWNQTGRRARNRFIRRAGMAHTELNNEAWGLSLITAHDEVTLLKLLTTRGRVLSTPSRRYVLYLMAHVEPGQRWGVTAGASAKVTVHVKNGWLPYPSHPVQWNINSIGAFTGTGITYQIAMLTTNNQSEDYGIDTIRDACRYLNWNLAAS